MAAGNDCGRAASAPMGRELAQGGGSPGSLLPADRSTAGNDCGRAAASAPIWEESWRGGGGRQDPCCQLIDRRLAMIADVQPHLLRSGKRAGAGAGGRQDPCCQLIDRRLAMIADVPHPLRSGKRAGAGAGVARIPAAS
uniref:Uncharacterized protein n=1 Tax=Peronospora matthiolae TaxID=2874970 RepID=A0AAV1VAW2_9STRA